MPDEKDLIVRGEVDLANISVSATNPAAVPLMQPELAAWARLKLARTQTELGELNESIRIAQENGFRRAAFDRAAKHLENSAVYFSKLVAALDAGYCVFPTTEVEIFAVRTKRRSPDAEKVQETNWHSDPFRGQRTVPAQTLPQGEGRYVDDQPVVYMTNGKARKIDEKTGQETIVDRQYFHSEEFRDEIDFPIELAKPELLTAVGRAQALKVFDEMGILPRIESGRNADPVIVGRIINPRTKRRVSFLIGWFIPTAELG